MIVWSGFGFLVPLIAFAAAILTNYSVDKTLGSQYYNTHGWPIFVAMLLAAIPIWFLGNYLANRAGQIVIDKATGQEINLRKTHSLFFIPVQWWAPLCLLLGIGLWIFHD